MTDKTEISIEIPSPVSENTIIFPYNFKTRKYEIAHYTPKMTENSLSVQEVSDYLNEVEGHLVQWHKASYSVIIFIINLLSIMPGIGFLVFLTKIMPEALSLQQVILTMVVIAATLFGLLLIRIIILDICNLKQLKVIQEITDKFGPDLDRTADSVQNSNYIWTFPVNFPAAIHLQKQGQNDDDMESFVGFSLEALRMQLEREQNKDLISA